MAYQITGISPAEIDLSTGGTEPVYMVATSKPGFPCRVTLEDADEGEELVLFNHVSHDVQSPYRTSYAIFVRTGAAKAAQYTDEVPPVFAGRTLALRGFGTDAMLKSAELAVPGSADKTIRQLFALEEVAYIDVHNAAHGCFVARVERFAS